MLVWLAWKMIWACQGQITICKSSPFSTNLSRDDFAEFDSSLTIFFISYALAEPLTGPLIKKMTPRVYFTGIILAWGLIMTLMGLVTNFSGLLAARFFLGLAEAGLFPGKFSALRHITPC